MKDIKRLALFVPLLLVILPFFVWPAVSGLAYSFTNYAPGQMHLQWTGARNYLAVFQNPDFVSSWRNILVFTLFSVPAELALGFILAYLLRAPFKGRELVRVLLLFPWLVSPIASGVMWHFLFDLQVGMLNYALAWLGLTGLPSPLGLGREALGVVIILEVWRNAPLVSFLLLPGLEAIPDVDWEYALIEGASLWQQVRQVAIPGLVGLSLPVALLLTGDALGTFDMILILTGGGPGSATLTPALFSYQQAFQTYNWPVGATSAWLIVLSMVLIGLAYLKIMRAEAG